MNIYTHRDLTVIEQPQGFLIAACDSCGGIGPKEGDVVPTDGLTVGYYTANVVLAELIAAGAEPFFLANALAVERDPTGNEIIAGVSRAAREAGIKEAAVTGSTEENIPVNQTAMGITAMGTAPKWPVYKSIKGDVLVMAGTPRVGKEVTAKGDDDRLTLGILNQLRKDPVFSFIHEIIPVGSRGSLAEAKDLAITCGLTFNTDFFKYQTSKMNSTKISEMASASGGPATCAVLSLPQENLPELERLSPLSIRTLGQLQ